MQRVKKILFIGAIIVSAASWSAAHAATLSFMSGVQTAAIGDTIDVSVRIDSQGQTVNAAQGTIEYPSSILQVVHVDHSNSIFNIWAQEPAVNTSTGQISFLGGSTNSFSGTSLYILDITFVARGSGLAALDFVNAGVTAGDGTGANILSSSTVISFRVGGASVPQNVVSSTAQGATSTQALIPQPIVQQAPPTPTQIKRPAVPTTTVPVAPVLSVGLYPDQTAWYNTIGNFLVQWPLPLDVTDVATAVNQNPQFDPTVSEGLFGSKTFGAVDEGIWYLHVRFKNSVGWGPTANYRIAIDTTPPFPFAATVKEGTTTEVSAPTVQFSTKDQPSGIAFYQIFTDGNAAGTTTNTSFVLPSLSFGSHPVVVQAVDYAGNITESRLSVTVAQPPFFIVGGIKITEEIFFGTIIAVIVLGILIGWWIGRREKRQRKNRGIIAGRDVSTGFGVVEKNVDKLLDATSNGSGESQMANIKFLLTETKGEIEKMKHYVSENVEEIEK
jgi:hypothetical protein